MKKKKNFRRIKPNNQQSAAVLKLHDSIETLKLNRFIACIVNQDLTGLAISGEPDQQALQMAWVKVVSEYHDRRKNEDVSQEMEGKQENDAYGIKSIRIKLLILMMRKKYHEKLANELLEEGYEYDFTEETYLDDLERVEAELESEAMYLPKEDDSKKEAVTAQSFNKAIINLIKHFSLSFTPVEFAQRHTVAEYADYCNQFDEDMELLANNKQEVDDGDE